MKNSYRIFLYTVEICMFAGQRDRDGLRFLYRRGMRISVAAGMLLLLINAVFPGPLATIFGAKEQALFELAKSSLPLVGIFVIALSVVLPTSVLYQVLDHLKLSMIASVALMVSALAGFAISVYLIGARAIWLAFPIAAVLAITILLISSQIVRRRSPHRLRFLSLIACAENDPDSCLSISVECVEKFPKRLTELEAFLFNALRVIRIVPTPEEEQSDEKKIRDVKGRPILRAAHDRLSRVLHHPQKEGQ